MINVGSAPVQREICSRKSSSCNHVGARPGGVEEPKVPYSFHRDLEAVRMRGSSGYRAEWNQPAVPFDSPLAAPREFAMAVRMPASIRTGLGGQPGTVTSTGM